MSNKIQNKDSENGLFGKLKFSAEFLGLLVAILTSITFLLKKVGAIELTEQQLLILVDILNLAVLVSVLYFIKPSKLELEDEEIKKLQKRLNIDEKSCNQLLERTNELIEQLVYCIRWFSIILGVFYVFQLFTDIYQPPYETFKNTIKNSKSILEIFANKPLHYLDSAKYLVNEFFNNSANLFSASFLFLAFQVLFLVTLEDDNKTWRLKSWIPFSIAILITVLNLHFFINGVFDSTLSSISHVMRLLGGIYNGVAMFLLFSRFVSMEFFFQNASKDWHRWFYFYGIAVVLPLYVVAQPMYGIFNAVEIGESAELFKAIVFLVCFWGKLFFFLFIYTMLIKKWFHSYLFIVLSQKSTLSKFSHDLKDVEDF